MAFTLPELPYALNALEPIIDAKTMEIHHGKHHNAYVTNLNAALTGVEGVPECIWTLCCKIEEIVPADKRTAVRNNGGGHANHSMFWKTLAPKGKGGAPSAALQAAIDADLGGVAAMKEAFAKAATTRFGSGWAWIIVKADGKLAITSTPNQDNPAMPYADVKGKPILGLDVWEHAYYLNYQNRRPDYITAFWDIVNWDAVSAYYAKHTGAGCGTGCGCKK